MALSILVPGTGSHTGTMSIRPLLRTLLSIFSALHVLLLFSCNPADTLTVEVLSVRPHDPAAYTQGLLLHEEMLYESTGRYRESSLRRVDPHTGEVLQRVDLPPDIFGEGLARHGNRLVQLTYRKRIALVYEIEAFGTLGQFSYQGQGWGLCYDGEHFIMSNGSAMLTVRDPATFGVVDQIYVTTRRKPRHESERTRVCRKRGLREYLSIRQDRQDRKRTPGRSWPKSTPRDSSRSPNGSGLTCSTESRMTRRTRPS